MDEKDWLILKTLRDKRSITKTAAAVFISQPALSKRLRQMEERFGVPLAVRNKNGVELTPEGAFLAAGSDALLATVRSMDEQVRSMRGDLQGTLRIGASYFCTRFILPDLLMQFKQQYPLVEFHLEGGWSSDIARMVNSGELHVGFIRNEQLRVEFSHVILRERTFLCSRNPLDMARLHEEPQISHRSDPLVRARFDAWWAAHYAVPPRISMEVDQVSTCAEMVLRGLGYGVLSELVTNRMRNIHRHEIFHQNGEPYFRQAWLISTSAARQLRLVATFTDYAMAYRYENTLGAQHPDI